VQRLLPVLQRIARDEGIGVLLVEQHVHLALESADRGYILSRGRVVLEGEAKVLATRPDLVQMSYLGEAAAE
jgi:branched-chain amino acid transport system ATP-binding protein